MTAGIVTEWLGAPMRVAVALALVAGLVVGVKSATAEQLSQPVNRWWVGVASSQDLDIAIGIARLYAGNQSRIVTAQNGWYAVVLGPVTSNSLSDYRASYKGWPALPGDVLVSRGNGYLATVWQPPPSPILASGELASEKIASLSAQGLQVAISSTSTGADNASIGFKGVTSEGVTFQLDAPPEPSSEYGSRAFLVRLDKTTKYPQAVGTLFSGGAHCCTDTLIATETPPDHWETVETGALDGDGYALEDIDGDGAAELVSVDNSFLYAFDSYAGSFAPIRIQRLVRGRLEDVTRDPIFIHRLRQDLAGMEYMARQNPDLWHSNGFLAGWVADKARLGELADAWTKMIPLYDHSSTFGEMICTTGDTVANCPQADVRTLPFPEGLAKHLVDNGYGPIPSDLAEVDPSIFPLPANAPQPAPPDQTSVAVQPNQAPPEPNRGAAHDISQGTGFYVAVDRLLTNAHVVEGCSDVTVTFGGVTAKGAIVARDPTNDLAIIKVGTPSATVAKLRTGLRLGENVSAFGFPLNGLLASSGNFTRGNVTAVAGLGDDTRYVQISDPVQPGNSGGPLLDEGANVVGIVSAKLNALRVAAITNDVAQNVNFAIKAATIEGFLDANGVQYQTGELGAPLAPADVAQAAAGFSGLVYCH